MDSLWRKAWEAAEDARLLFERERYDGACNPAYYAMFNAARALLIQQGINPEKAKRHATVLRLFSMHFVQDGPFESADGRALGEAGRARSQADYSSRGTDAETARDVLASLDRFMTIADRLIDEGQDTGGSRP